MSDFAVVFYAAKAMESESLFGHAFMCIETRLSSGVKEDCYGFYMKGTADRSWYIGGTDLVDEFKRDPDRFPSISASYRASITVEQRQRIFTEMSNWKADDYSLFSYNCIDFIDRVAAIAGVKRPPRSAVQSPTQFVALLGK